jgi:hypothetical protein
VNPAFPAQGGCVCRAVRYRMESAPLVVHACHCTWCQRETGSAFALNALIESDRVSAIGVAPEMVLTPSNSGAGQRILRCPSCEVAVWSHYSGAGESIRFVRVGTLDDPNLAPPDIHIFTSTKQPWVVLPKGAKVVSEYYRQGDVWRAESLQRWAALKGSSRP